MTEGADRAACCCVYECRCDPERKARRRELERQLLADRKLYGFAVISADGERVDPRTVRMAMDE